MLLHEIIVEQTDFNLEDLIEIEDGLTGESKKGTLGNFLLTALAKIPIAWIPVTYINSWVDYSVAYGGSAYFKDIFGFVHLRLSCKNGITNAPFILPSGYRPIGTIAFPICSNSTSNTWPAVIIITSAGVVTFAQYVNDTALFGEIIYRAEN